MAELLDTTGGHLLAPLHKEAISLLRALFRASPSHRPSVVQELLPLLAQTYAAKSPVKTFSLSGSSLVTSSGTGLKIAMVLLFD